MAHRGQMAQDSVDQDIRLHALFPEEAAHLIGDVLVVGAGGEGLGDVGDVGNPR